MNFLNRLKYYLIGVGLGILMVLAIFKDRKLTSWTPKNQVLKELATKEFIIPEDLACTLKCGGYQNEIKIKEMFEKSTVDFSSSDVSDHENRKYLVMVEDSIIQSVTVTILDSFIEFNKIEASSNACNCK